jgi:tRNA(Ile2) C34 agmatinyltransferase TiaS
MTVLRSRNTVGTDVVSSILNWVCPECGGRMGGHGKEFKCQGVCQTDWRQIWERGLSVGLASAREERSA